MGDTSITKVSATTAPQGKSGQKYLAGGISMAMRLWDGEPPNNNKEPRQRSYETIGYVVAGKAELELEGQTIHLEPGDSWVVPKGSMHTYRIIEPFTAVEVTHPPAEADGRDK